MRAVHLHTDLKARCSKKICLCGLFLFNLSDEKNNTLSFCLFYNFMFSMRGQRVEVTRAGFMWQKSKVNCSQPVLHDLLCTMWSVVSTRVTSFCGCFTAVNKIPMRRRIACVPSALTWWRALLCSGNTVMSAHLQTKRTWEAVKRGEMTASVTFFVLFRFAKKKVFVLPHISIIFTQWH